MTVFKLMITLLRREWKSIIIYLVVFMFLSLLNAQSGALAEFSLKSYPVAVVDERKDETSQGLIEYLSEHHKVEVTNLSPIDARDNILLGRYSLVLYLEKDQSRVLTSPSDPSGYSVISEADSYLRYEKILGKGEELKEIMNLDIPLHVESKQTSEEMFKDRWISMYFSFFGYLFMAVGIMIVGQSMLEMSEEKVYLRTKMSSYPSVKIYAETLLALLSTLVLFIVILFAAGSVIVKEPLLNRGTLKYLPGILLMGINSIALATMLASAFRSKVVLSAASTTVSLVLSFISGLFVPAALLPSGLLQIAKFFPLYYYVEYIQMGQSLGSLGMLALFTLIYILLGIYVTRERRKA